MGTAEPNGAAETKDVAALQNGRTAGGDGWTRMSGKRRWLDQRDCGQATTGRDGTAETTVLLLLTTG